MPSPSLAAQLIPHLWRAVLASDATGVIDGQLLAVFVRTIDQTAFTAQVRRQGPMALVVFGQLFDGKRTDEQLFDAQPAAVLADREREGASADEYEGRAAERLGASVEDGPTAAGEEVAAGRTPGSKL